MTQLQLVRRQFEQSADALRGQLKGSLALEALKYVRAQLQGDEQRSALCEYVSGIIDQVSA